MASRILGMVALGLIAAMLLGITLWAYNGYRRMTEISSVMNACVRESKAPGAHGDALDRCLAKHGIDFHRGPVTLGSKVRSGNLTTETSVTSNDAPVLLACNREPEMARLTAGSSAWASALSSCLKRHGAQSTIERQVDLNGGVSFSVKQP
jgi:hypothetical protein